MPNNKNALTRYKFLDEMLSDKHHFYNIHDLTSKCNEKLVNAGLTEVSQRCIEKDIKYLEYDPFFAEIKRFWINGKRCIRYEDPTFSIFKKKLSEEESNLISEVFNTIGQFDGLDNFEWLNNFKAGLELKERPKIISFSNNPYLLNSNFLGALFSYISNQVVIELEYHTFNNDEKKKISLHPYLLKQYNDRWYVIGAADKDKKILNFALDRIDSITPKPEMQFSPHEGDLSERFDDIVGISLYEDRPIEHIVFWVSEESQNYVVTKPIHGSQKKLKEDDTLNLRDKNPLLKNGAFFSIDCIPNYELIRMLCSFGSNLLVISPESVQDEIYTRIESMHEKYSSLRT